jgi:hypothetical protein
MPNREIKLKVAVNKLSKYYDLLTTSDLSQYIAAGGAPTSTQPTGTPVAAGTAGTRPSDADLDRNDVVLGELINNFLDVSEGAYTTAQLLNIFAQRFGIATQEQNAETNALKEKYKRLFHIVSDAQYAHDMPFPETMAKLKTTGIARSGESVTTQMLRNNNIINSNPNDPSKTHPGLSVIVSNTNQVSVANRFTNACSLFLNSIPAIEMSKAMPYLEVNILFPSRAINNNRLNAPSIYKFLFGGATVDNGSILENLSLANQENRLAGSNPDAPTSYTTIGMEAFLMPQTLVNADNINDTQISANPAIDKFRPFLSLKEFSFNEAQAFQAYGFKTGKLSLTLHDRSRLSQIAEFVRSDLRGGTEVLIEFGWCHMEAEQASNPKNIYADIINGMRKRCKFQVVNSSFTFDDNGQVEVNLDLSTLGETSLTTEPSVGDGVNVTDSIRIIDSITEEIARLRSNSRLLNPPATTTTATGQQQSNQQQQSTSSSREIRGIQFLNVAQDAYSNLTLTREQQQEMRTLLASLQHMPNESEVRRIRNLLGTLYDDQQGHDGPNRTGGTGSATERLRSQIQNQIRDKMNSLKKNNHDPFLLSSNDVEAIQAAATRIAARRRAAAAAAAEAASAAAETARLAEIDQRNQARAQAMIEESRAADAAAADQERTAQIESGERRWVPDPPDVQSISGIGALRTPRA